LALGVPAAAQQGGTANCPYGEAYIYFDGNPTPVLDKYADHPSYYCSDILYLERLGRGNISPDEYRSLYPAPMRGQFDYLRELGLTPDVIERNMGGEVAVITDGADGVSADGENRIVADVLTDRDSIQGFVEENMRLSRLDAAYVVANDGAMEGSGGEGEYGGFSATPGIVVDSKNSKVCIRDRYNVGVAPADSVYASGPSYYDVMVAIRPALRPVAIKGNDLVNLLGETVATIDYDAALSAGSGGETIRNVRFVGGVDGVFQSPRTVQVRWAGNKCRAGTVEEIVEKHSVCYLCPYVVMVFNQISYLFEYMYTTFQYAVIALLVLFGCFAFATAFFKGLKDYPFAMDFSNYYKDVGETTRLVMLASIIAVMPPKTLFSFTVAPVIDLTLAVSGEVLATGNEFDRCDAKSVVSDINSQKSGSSLSAKILPPVVKESASREIRGIEDSYVLDKETVGNIVCFMANLVRSNAKQKMMGEVLIRNWHPIYGFAILGLFTLINLLMSFYILDGFVQILKIAMLWPFLVFGYAFKWLKLEVSLEGILDTAKDFGFTMVALAVFTLFNTIMIHGFFFTVEGGGSESLLGILDRAANTNDVKVILDAVSGSNSLLEMSKFLFIVFCMFYVYSRLSEFTKAYSGGSAGEKPIGDAVRKLVLSGVGMATGVTREAVGAVKKKAAGTGKKGEATAEETTAEETSEVRSE
jgi:hypothetical protein